MMSNQPTTHRNENASNSVLGCLDALMLIFAFGTSIVLMLGAALFCWWGSSAILELTGASGITKAVLGAIIALVSAILSMPLGALVGTIGIRKQINEPEKSAFSFAWFFAVLFLALQAIADPMAFIPLVVAPLFCGWLFHSMAVTTAAMWSALIAPAIGFGVGVMVSAGINDTGNSG